MPYENFVPAPETSERSRPSTPLWWTNTVVLLLLTAGLLFLVGFSVWFGFVRAPEGTEDYRDLYKAGVVGGVFFGVPAAATVRLSIRRFRRRFVPTPRSLGSPER